MSRDAAGVVVVGAGHAGGAVAGLLRQNGWQGPITLVGEEPVLPYQRPPLSKAWHTGEAQAERVALKPAGFYPESRIDVRLGTRVVRVDRHMRVISISSGEMLFYEKLILATGSRSRALQVPGRELCSILELRTMADAEKLKAELVPGRRITIIGGGYIGLEVAASARKLGVEVTLVEREGRLLARVASEPISELFTQMHRSMGVAVEVATNVTAIEGANGRVTGVRLHDGRLIACDAVLVGIGATANDELARAAGLACQDGIVVGINALTSDPNIYAIGDCTRRPLALYDASVRLESVANALEQARQAACHICGTPAPLPEVPWFWSDQYDLKLQIAGMPIGVSRQVARWQEGTARFAMFHLDANDRVQAVEAVNAAGDYMAGRAMIAKRTPVDAAKLADPSIPIKTMMG